MPKRVSSKIAGYTKPNQDRLKNDQVVNADITKGFLQSQAMTSDSPQQNNSQEIVQLLSKINDKLENLQNSFTGGQSQQSSVSPQSASPQPQGKQQPGQPSANSQTDSAMSQELRNLFSMLLQNSDGQNDTVNASQPQDGQQSQRQEKGQTEDSTGNKQPANIAVQTAAQVLAQAQYELSNELEASLKKLKQVISESEKIAVKISNLLGEEDSQQQ